MSRAEPLRDDLRASELEPSMEEILASIRRILAEGQGLWNGSQETYREHDETDPGFRLDSHDASSSASAHDSRRDPADAREPVARARSEPRCTTTARRGSALASGATEASVAAAFQTLVASRFVRNSDLVADLTREMIRPLLEAWIDEHLPGIVERLVTAEIARIVRGD